MHNATSTTGIRRPRFHETAAPMIMHAQAGRPVTIVATRPFWPVSISAIRQGGESVPRTIRSALVEKDTVLMR